MGTSHTGRHADGPALYGVEAAWPPRLRAGWTDVVRGAARRLGVAAPVAEAVRVTRRPIIARGVLHGPPPKAPRGWDEAEAAWVAGALPATAGRSTLLARLRLLERTERALGAEARRVLGTRRLRQPTRLALRTELLAALAAWGDDEPTEAALLARVAPPRPTRRP